MPHVELLIHYRDGQPQREPVHAEVIEPGVFRLRYSPGFVLGIAAGDEFRLAGTDGSFSVTKRAGNLAVQVFSSEAITLVIPTLRTLAASLGGVVDGNIERGAVLTIPVATGFSKIEAALSELCQSHSGLEWIYGNVYDPADGKTPLRWWEARA